MKLREERTELLRYFEIGRQGYVSRSGRLGKVAATLPDDDADFTIVGYLEERIKKLDKVFGTQRVSRRDQSLFMGESSQSCPLCTYDHGISQL